MPEGVAVSDELKKHFGQSNLLHKLRNTIAYHHPSAPELEAAFEDVPEDEDWGVVSCPPQSITRSI